ncbi:Archaellum protein D/E [Halorhabdus sp. BNX81]|nr:Archaellum protein D/E [Halorhabdus sp. BNX81]
MVGEVGQPLLDATGGWIVESVGSVSAEPLAVAILTTGALGMSIRSVFDSILSDEGDASSSVDGGGDDGLMPEEGGDDLDDLGGGFGGGDDDFGEFEDDEFGGMEGGGGADTDELQHRLDELETEVGSLSSTVNTVRNENEQISETVDDVEENVRKLLDIYEMVTRGVNPFADDIDAGGLGGPGDESFGLFDDGGDQTEEEDLDEGIANADAEGFFDEDLVEDGDDLEADTDVGDVLGTDEDAGGSGDAIEDEFDDDFEMDDDEFGDIDDGFDDDFEMDDGGDTDDEENDGDGEGGKSFAELKDEYESGDAEWAEGEEKEGEASPGESVEDVEDDADELLEDDATDILEDAGGEDEAVTATDEADDANDGLADDELFDTVIEDDGNEADDVEQTETVEETVVEETAEPVDDTADPDQETATEELATEETATEEAVDHEQPTEPEADTTAGETTAEAETETADDDDGKPYLTALPDGFLADLIVVEWLEFLVEEVGVRDTAEAIDYYERIDWIDESVADQLRAYLKGFDEGGEAASLTIDHHTRSLRYVSQLNGGGAESIALQQVPRQTGGGPDGIQR